MVEKKRKRTLAEVAADRLRTGRPPKSPAEKQGERIIVRLTKAERAKLERLAKRKRLPLAAFIRQVLTSQEEK